MSRMSEVHNQWALGEWAHYEDRMATHGHRQYEYIGDLIAEVGPKPVDWEDAKHRWEERETE